MIGNPVRPPAWTKLLLGLALLWPTVLWPTMLVAHEMQDYSDFADLDLESLLGQTITSVSKYEQRLGDAPMAATVIGAEDIAASGARCIPELLRTVPGLDVMQTSASSWEVSARGLNKAGSNTMLVMVDGRAVYMDLYGNTMWDMLPVSMEEIKSIEIILGPGSAMYGANAFAGIINIKTFAAYESEPRQARVLTSSQGDSYASVGLSGPLGAGHWKFHSSWNRSENHDRRGPLLETARWEGQYQHPLSGGGSLFASVGNANGRSLVIPSDAPLSIDGHTEYARLDLTRGQLQVRWYMNHLQAQMLPLTVTLEEDTYAKSLLHDLEARYSLVLGNTHHLFFGSSYRHYWTSFSQQGDHLSYGVHAAFLHDEWRFHRKASLFAGLRFDHHPTVGGQVAPRASLVYRPRENHSFRLSYSKAFRDPSFLETHWQSTHEVTPGFPQTVGGDINNESEIIEGFETGYQGMLARGLVLQFSLYHNRLRGLIDLVPVAFFPPPAPPGFPQQIAFLNLHDRDATGGEVALQADLSETVRLSANYSYVWLEDANTGDHPRITPVHHATLSALLQPWDEHQIKLTGRFRGQADRILGTQVGYTFDVEEAFVLDASWNKLIGYDRRVVLGVQNFLDRRYREYTGGFEQRRRLFLSLSQSF